MSELYYLLAAVSYGIFLIQFVLSWFGGDTDLDVDFDGELDMDVSDLVSFKGLVHFVMGASGWLCVKQSISNYIDWYDYLIALICGIVFVVILYYLYKLCLKLQHQVVPETGQALVGKTGIVYLSHFTGRALVTLEINGGTDDILMYQEDSSKLYRKGDQVRVTKLEDGKYYFN